MPNPLIIEEVYQGNKISLVDYLAGKSQISKVKLKHAMNCGALWFKKQNKGKLLKLRKAKADLHPGDYYKLYYDENILQLPAVESAVKVFENNDYGIWIKEEGVLTQGSEYGDHASLLRYLEKIKNNVYLIHRLDRETRGLVLFAYSQRAASSFSQLWQKNEVKKIYQAVVLGEMKQDEIVVEEKLDGKEAKSLIKVLKTKEMRSLVEVELFTGRFHQIRRHLEFLGHPIMGDPQYGKGNKGEKLKLEALKLSFIDPFDSKPKKFEIPPQLTII